MGALYLIFHSIWNNPKKRKVMYLSTPMIYESVFYSNSDWVEFYGDVAEEDTPRMPYPLGEPVLTFTFVYSDHDSNFVTRRSHTGILLFVCKGVIKDFSKQQNTVELCTFRSELMALHISRYLIVELRVKLKSIKVTLKAPTYIYCNNQGVAKNTINPKSTLKNILSVNLC